MWIYFNKDYKDNKRQDLIHMTDEVHAKNLIDKKIAQKIDSPHEFYENLTKKKFLHN